MLTELRIRGQNVRESGAFLLGPSRSQSQSDVTEVREIVYYDDLDAECLQGGIKLGGKAFDLLWKACTEGELTVVADVHTHPSDWIQQSFIDRTNPMIALPGHIALIVPNFARDVVSISDIGVYEYEGGHLWKELSASISDPVIIVDSPSNFLLRFRRMLLRNRKDRSTTKSGSTK
jgi:proteasome lid subunit RPN8/RPN11